MYVNRVCSEKEVGEWSGGGGGEIGHIIYDVHYNYECMLLYGLCTTIKFSPGIQSG